jgi:hypothetical protein
MKGLSMPAKPLPKLMVPSTRAFFQEARHVPQLPLFERLHGYVYGRWPYLYIGIGTGEHPLARIFAPLARLLGPLFPPRRGKGGEKIDFADTYHGKVVTLEAATQLVTVDREVTLPDLEQIIPYRLARDLILKNPDHILALQCPCRSNRANPCLPLDVCLVVGEPFASFVWAFSGSAIGWPGTTLTSAGRSTTRLIWSTRRIAAWPWWPRTVGRSAA